MGRLFALTLALLAAALIAWSQLRLPDPLPANAPETAFSAARALDIDREIAARPHPMGSPANHAVRDRLRARMEELGLSTRLRRDDVVGYTARGRIEGGSAETLVGVLPGRDRTQPPVALMAHYDSVPGAPGAADDGAGVSAALEVVRAIAARGPPARDVAVILTDGEEAGLLGAQGFFARDPLARRLGMALNLEARGSGGRALMFETGPQDGAAMDVFRRAAVRPLTGSLFGAVYAWLPNDTDFTIARRAGLGGYNWAFTGRAFDYHSPTDSLANLQPGALQDMGEQALATAAALAFAPSLPAKTPDVVHGVLFGRAMLAYRPAWGWLVLAGAAGLLKVAAMRASRQGALPWTDIGRGAAEGLYAIAASVAVWRLAAAVAGWGGELGARRLLADAGRWEAALGLLGLGVWLATAAEAARGRRAALVAPPLVAGAASLAVAGGLDPVCQGSGLTAALLALALGARPLGRPGAWAGVLALGLLLSAMAQALAPLTAYELAWPLALGALAAAATGLDADRRPWARPALLLLAAAGLGWTGVMVHLIVVVVGAPELLALPLLTAAMVAWPLVQPDPEAPAAALPGRALLAAGAALTAVVALASPWSARHPRPAAVAYQLDQDTGRAWRVAQRALRTDWSDAALQADGGRIGPFRHWAWPRPMDAAPARLAPISPPAVSLTRGPDDLVAVKVAPPAGARTLALELSPRADARLEGVGGANADIALPAGQWTSVRWTAPNADGLTLTLRATKPGLQLRYIAGFDRWPSEVAPPTAPATGVIQQSFVGQAVATGSRTLAW